MYVSVTLTMYMYIPLWKVTGIVENLYICANLLTTLEDRLFPADSINVILLGLFFDSTNVFSIIMPHENIMQWTIFIFEY